MPNRMRIPWIATLDALIDEISQYVDEPEASTPEPVQDVRTSAGVIEFLPVDKEMSAPDHLPQQPTILDVLQGLREIREVMNSLSWTNAVPRSADPRYLDLVSGSLESIEEQRLRYPDLGGREGLARFIEPGGLIGPLMGQHIAGVIRGVIRFDRGQQTTYEDGRVRRWTVKHIATIRHLYDVGLDRAINMLCDAEQIDDPEGKVSQKYREWVRRDIRDAKNRIAKNDLSERDRHHYSAIIHGLHPDFPRGHLKGQTYPNALKKFRKY